MTTIIRANLTEGVQNWKRNMWHGATPWDDFRKEKKLNSQLANTLLGCIKDESLKDSVTRVELTHQPREVFAFIHVDTEEPRPALQIIDQLRLRGVYSYIIPAKEEDKGLRYEPGYTKP